MIDPILIKKALGLGIDVLYDADGDGDIDIHDLNIIKAIQIAGVTEKLGTQKAIDQFENIEQAAKRMGHYKGTSLAWGSMGTSDMLKDKMLVKGYSPEDAETIAKTSYVSQRYDRINNGLPV